MEALKYILKTPPTVPDFFTLEKIQDEFSQRVHIPYCFSQCSELVEPNTSYILYTNILIIAGVPTVLTLIRCPVCNSITVTIYEYLNQASASPTLACIYRKKLETALNIHTFFKQYAPHISELEIPLTSSIRTCNKYILLTLTNYYTYLLIKNKQKYKLCNTNTCTYTDTMLAYCTSNTPPDSYIDQVLPFLANTAHRQSVAPALLYYLLTIPSIPLDKID